MEDYHSTRPARPSSRPIAIGLLGAFVLGGALAGYGVYRFGGYDSDAATDRTASVTARPLAALPPGPDPVPSATGSEAAQAVERVAEQQGGLDQRIAAAEQRIARQIGRAHV